MFPETSNLNKLFSESRDLVDAELRRLIPSKDQSPENLHCAIHWSLFAGGKRFRPALVFAVGRVFGAAPEKLVCTAAAIEMIHTYSLIHDDLPAMDNDDMRRGRETCHVKFGEATAILAGDVLQALAFEAIADDKNLDHETRIQLISEIAKAAGTPNGMAAGQQLDLESEGKTITAAQLEEIHRNKTGAMIAVSARAGAIIAGATAAEINAINEYGRKVGLLFQITDDLLDVTQPTEVLGKTAGKDAEANKATYPGIFGVERSRELAAAVCSEAKTALEPIKNDTTILAEIAKSLLYRNA